jgi:hypothetical protein
LKEEAAQRGLDAKADLWKMPSMAVGFMLNKMQRLL